MHVQQQSKHLSPDLDPVHSDRDPNGKRRDTSGIGDKRNSCTTFFRRGMGEHDMEGFGEGGGEGGAEFVTVCVSQRKGGRMK